ncbi:putative glutamine amidotransferase [Desulfobotulus alkaliphilus]|uniref:Putative glutamine amidotransferase n=1 Tax=Desulfobotulus alkaliphilus TaxID=622671 RepID=A0A562SAA1_9BACT|nr:type 1 glutamine amidotransferase [Desulfobotulus alkaliphilus]TWI77486.1 putative glutamine amidotransferase [Desulfobotulus alkaliphilus]
MKKPLIGITTSDYKSHTAWLFDWFAVWRHGGIPLRLSPERPFPDHLDGLIIGGGDDIEACLYGGEVLPDVRIDPLRDKLEMKLLASFIPEACPVLGICRGAQLINIFFGGTLYQDIYTENKAVKNQRTVLPRKHVDIRPHTRLHRLLKVDWCRVNSLHHQAVKNTGKGIRVTAMDRYGLVQAIESVEHDFLLGVQWHPEWLVLNRPQQRLIRSLVHAAGKRIKKQ